MNYTTLEGQQILAPHISVHEHPKVLAVTDNSYKFYVPPGDTKMVIIRCNVQGYKHGGSKSASVVDFKP